MFVIIVSFTMVYITAKQIHIDFVEHNADQVFIDTWCMTENMFHDVDFGLTPFNDKNKRIDEVRRPTDVYYRCKRWKINDNVVVTFTKLLKQFLHRGRVKNFVRVCHAGFHHRWQECQVKRWLSPNYFFKRRFFG